MYKIVIVTNNKENFSSFARGLDAEKDYAIDWDDSKKNAHQRASVAPPDVMVIDEEVDGITNLEIARQIVVTNPMINLTLVSTLSPKDFHEASEGLGIVAQLPRCPGQEDVAKLLGTLRGILPPKAPG
jgi:CheY-like chemotaxis protein